MHQVHLLVCDKDKENSVPNWPGHFVELDYNDALNVLDGDRRVNSNENCLMVVCRANKGNRESFDWLSANDMTTTTFRLFISQAAHEI